MTEAGEVLARHARPLLAQQQRLRRDARLRLRSAGTLRLFANTSAMSAFLPGSSPPDGSAPGGADRNRRTHQRGYRQLYPAGVAQAGVVSDAVDPGPLRLDPVADDPLVLIVPPARPLAENRKWRLRRCSTSRWSPSIRPVRYSSISNSTQLNSAALNVRVRMSHFAGLCEMVAHGAGGAILPRVIAERYRQRYSFAVIGLQDRWAQRRLCLCYQDDASLSPAMRRLLEWLRQP